MHVSNSLLIYGSNLMGHRLGRAGFYIGFVLCSHKQSAIKPAGRHLSQLLTCLRDKSGLSGAGTPQLLNVLFAGTPPSCESSSSRTALCTTRLLPVWFNLLTATSDQILKFSILFFSLPPTLQHTFIGFLAAYFLVFVV